MKQAAAMDWRRHLRLQGVTLALMFLLLWTGELLSTVVRFQSGYDLDQWGIIPREARGLPGILLAPLLHVSASHLAANSLPLLLLASLILVEGARVFWLATGIILLVSGAVVWGLGAADSVYLGSSSLVYGYFGYILMRAWITRSPLWVALGLLSLLIYGGLGAALLTVKEGVSWLGHFSGLVAGMLAADQLQRWHRVKEKVHHKV
jgi:membrane associated rhomboid family serine protease